MENVSNSNSTNKFVNVFGALNIANIKLSGLYKIVVDLNNKLFLDNYNGYRFPLDVTKPFLPQVSDFIKRASNTNTKNINIKNAGYRNRTVTSWHVPLYLGEDKNSLPSHFVINNVKNGNIDVISDIHKYNQVIYLRDLKILGLSKIFEEIIDNQKYITPLFFNWGAEKMLLRGYDLNNKSNTTTILNTLDIQSNQNLIENSNNRLLNDFGKNNLIVPLFVNVEFEFDFSNNTGYVFNNFNGYFSSAKNITKNEYTDDVATVTLFEYINNTISYQQETDVDTIKEIPYQDVVVSSNLQIPSITSPQVNIKVSLIQHGDKITIHFPTGEIFFEYVVQVSDVKSTLLETMNFISKTILKLSNNSVVCDFNKLNSILKIKINISENNTNVYYIKTPKNWKFIDKTNNFENITSQDIRVLSNNTFTKIYDTQNVTQVLIGDNTKLNIVKGFYFDGYLILRLAYLDGKIFNSKSFFATNKLKVSLFLDKKGILTQLPPKPYLGVNTKFKVTEQYEKNKYISNLRTLFGENADQDKLDAFNNAIESFESSNNFVDHKPYVEVELIDGSKNIKELLPKTEVVKKSSNNDNNILDMSWSDGINSFIAPNTLNLDYRFYDKNANINSVLGVNDPLRFHWFLIKGETPKYISDIPNDVRNLRYFTDKPNLTTLLKSSTQTTDYCETTFLGVKYILPQKYKGYSFAVYLDCENILSHSVNYHCEVNHTNKTLYVVVSKYLDFVDLIRGGDADNNALIDLSFFYTVNEPHNTMSDVSMAFTTGGILLFDNSKEVEFNNTIPPTRWRHQDTDGKWYICVKKSDIVITPNFDEIVTVDKDFEFYVYSDVVIGDQTYTYTAMKYKLVNPHIVTKDYIWCEDVIVKFFDTKQFFVNEIVPDNPDVEVDDYTDIFSVSKLQLLQQPTSVGTGSGNPFQEQEFVTTILRNNNNHTLRLLNYDNDFSVKKDYFEFEQIVSYDKDGNKTITQNSFIFDEYPNQSADFTYFNTLFQYGSFDNITSTKITLIERNQLWKLICDIGRVQVIFKNQTKKQTLSSMNELLVSRLQEYLLINSLEIVDTENPNSDKFVKIYVDDLDTNAVIWKDENNVPKVTKIQRYSGNYLPQLTELGNELDLQNENSTLNENFGDNIFNIYSTNFNGVGVSGTGFWKDVNNIVSSLWTSKLENLKLVLPIIDGTVYSLIDIIKRVVPIEEAIIGHKNEDLIKAIDSNVDAWIHKNYAIWLLDNIWKLDRVVTIYDERLMFNHTDNYNVTLREKSFYQQQFDSATFVFVRR